MEDRKLRAVMAFAFLAGSVITIASLGLYLSNLQPWLLVAFFVLYSAAQVSTATLLYRRIYRSKLIDMPKRLRKRYPPLGYAFGEQADGDHYDVILLRPPSAVLSGPDSGEALGLGYLASILREAGKRVLVIDARLMGLDTMQAVELIMMYTTSVLGVNLNFQYLADSTQELLEMLETRSFSSHITLGGLYASVAYEQLMAQMKSVDTIVRFEGEATFQELVNQINNPDNWENIRGLVYRDQDGKIVVNPLRPLIADINTIGHPERDFLKIVSRIGGYAYVLSSRGCHGTCSYCVQQRSVSDPMGKRWRGRDPEDVVKEIKEIIETEDIRSFSFVDDDFFGDKIEGKTHAYRIAEAIIDSGIDISVLLSIQPRDVTYDEFRYLKSAGIESVILAVDNFSQPVLDRYRKFTSVEKNIESIRILDALGIDAYLGIIMFDPWTTLDELNDNMSIIGDLPFLRPWQVLSKLEIYKGSSITTELEEQGLLSWDTYTPKYEFITPGIKNVYLAIENVMKIVHPVLMELDKFRWGNLTYSEADTAVLKHSNSELKKLNTKFNREVISICRSIVEKQKNSSELLSARSLADPQTEKVVEQLNEETIREIIQLRRMSLENQNELELVHC